jgi:tyrosyl-tRNA synthetase
MGATTLTHGRAAAEAAAETSRALFGGDGTGEAVPTTALPAEEVGDGLSIVEALQRTGLVSSNGEARRAVAQGGVYLNGGRVDRADARLGLDDLRGDGALLRLGKKRYHRLILTR